MIESSIFKSYDIRGIYPSQLNENGAWQIGQGFVKYTGAKKVAIGYDTRISSPELFRSLAEGVISEGADVYFIGMVTTECLYFAVGHYDMEAGIMITASHNPKEYNGFKMVKKGEKYLEIVRGNDLFSVVSKSDFKNGNKGQIYEKDIFADYLEHTSSFIKEEIKSFKIVVDASNGVIGKIIEGVKNKLPLTIIDLNFQPDGNFPGHSPNPLMEGSTNQIKNTILNSKADFGFIFDADADRIFLADENGQLVSADITLLLLAKYLLKENPGSTIAYNAICSKAVPEFIIKWGGVPVRTAVGFVNVRNELIKNNGIMGGELSGHYCFRDYFYMDSGMLAFFILLQAISQDGRKLSQIIKELSVYFKSAEINFETRAPIEIGARPSTFSQKSALVEDSTKKTLLSSAEILEKVKEKYSDGQQDFLDGVTVEYKDWWFNVRPSNTEPLLRLTIEADTESLLEQKKKELSEFIKNAS